MFTLDVRKNSYDHITDGKNFIHSNTMINKKRYKSILFQFYDNIKMRKETIKSKLRKKLLFYVKKYDVYTTGKKIY